MNIENTYLWAVWKIGIAGLVFWVLPLALTFRYYIRINKLSQYYLLASAFFYSTVLVYVQTMTNPYLNNPIGLSFVLISLFSLRTLSRGQSLFNISDTANPIFIKKGL